MRSFFIIFFSRHRRIIPVISYRFITIVITVFYDPRDRKIWRRYEKRLRAGCPLSGYASMRDRVTEVSLLFLESADFLENILNTFLLFQSTSVLETRQARFLEIGDNNFALISTLEWKNGITSNV